MATDDIRVSLHLRELRVSEVVAGTPEVFRVKVKSSVRRPRCVACGFGCWRVHERREREIRDVEMSGQATVLVWRRRRFDCGHCGHRFTEEHLEFDGKPARRLARQMVADAQVMTFQAVARRHGVNWHTVMALVKAWSHLIVEHRRAQRCRVLLVDETSMRKRRRYAAVVQNGDTGKVLAMVEHRNSAALRGVFEVAATQMASGSESRRHRRIQSLQVRYRRLFAARPSCAGPVPHPSDGSQPGSVRCAATSDAANPKGSNPPTTQKCSDPGSCCCAEATNSPPHNK